MGFWRKMTFANPTGHFSQNGGDMEPRRILRLFCNFFFSPSQSPRAIFHKKVVTCNWEEFWEPKLGFSQIDSGKRLGMQNCPLEVISVCKFSQGFSWYYSTKSLKASNSQVTPLDKCYCELYPQRLEVAQIYPSHQVFTIIYAQSVKTKFRHGPKFD